MTIAAPALRAAPNRLLRDPVRLGRSPGIDCLRGLFALWVLFGHLVPWALVTHGRHTPATDVDDWLIRVFQGHHEANPAVLGFIVLSGYCIHRNGLRLGSLNLRAYATRRTFRIVPVYLAACAVGVLLFALNSSDPLAQALTGTSAITVSGLAAKLTTISAVLPSAYVPSFQGNAPLVTVAAEMWLYVFYALMITRSPRVLGPTILVVWLIGTAWTAGHPEYLGWWHIGSLPGFLPYWWLGALFVNPGFWGRRPAAIAAAAVGWLALSLLLDGHTSSLWVVEARKLAFAVLIGALIVGLDGARHAALTAGSRIGRAGYSIYALHAPIIVALLIAGVPWFLCAVAAIAVALVSFSVFEHPLTRVGARRAARLMEHRPHQAPVPRQSGTQHA